jgi:hypothetical protein
VDADGATDERAGGGRQKRVVLMPRRWHQVGGNKFPPPTVARKPGHRGERVISRKPLRREGRMLPLNLYARVRFFLCNFAHETAGAARTRSSLRPLYFRGRNEPAIPRAKQAAGMRSHVLPSLRRKFVGWAKARLRRAHHGSDRLGMVGTLALCPPYARAATKSPTRRPWRSGGDRSGMDCFAEPVIGRLFPSPLWGGWPAEGRSGGGLHQQRDYLRPAGRDPHPGLRFARPTLPTRGRDTSPTRPRWR